MTRPPTAEERKILDLGYCPVCGGPAEPRPERVWRDGVLVDADEWVIACGGPCGEMWAHDG